MRSYLVPQAIICIAVVLCGCGQGSSVSVVSPAMAQQPAGGTLFIEGGTLIDGNGGAPVPDSAMLIEDGRITAIGRQGELTAPDGVRVIRADGKYVVPGLIDAKSNYASNFGEAYLIWGVTSAIWSGGGGDAGFAERDAINHGIFRGPRLFTSYTAISGPTNESHEPSAAIPGRYGYSVQTPEEARELAIKIFEAGADFISAGDGDGPPELFAALVDEAHKRGKAAVMRTVGVEVTAKECADIGCDVVIHTGNIGNRIAEDPEKWRHYVGLPPDQYADMDDEKAADMVAYLVERNLALEPDLIATGRGFPRNWARVQRENETWHNNDPALLAYFPEYQQGGYVANVVSPETYLTPEQMEIRRAGFDNHTRFLKMYVDAGGHILPASDIPQSPPGLGVHQEMAVFQEDVGLTPMQVLQSATSWAAEHFYLPDLGTLETGKLADIVIVNADPTADILNLREIDTVIKNGDVVDRTYHADYLDKTFRAGLFLDGSCCFATPVVEGYPFFQNVFGLARLELLKEISEALIPADGWAGGGPISLDSVMPGTPIIEGIMPWVVDEGSPTTTVTLTGFNFVRGSKAYLGDEELPSQALSPTELTVTVDESYLKPGTHFLTIKNPTPVKTPLWGDTSNAARLLVPYAFTTRHSNNQF